MYPLFGPEGLWATYSRDAAAAQVFAVVRELIHIARAESGVSADALLSHEERYANAVAAGVLIPAEMLQHLKGADDVLEAARMTAAPLKVSAWAVLTRAFLNGILSQEAYRRAVGVIKQTRAEASIKGKKKQRGSGFYVQKLDALGQNLSSAMLSAVNAGELLYRDFWALSGIKPAQVSDFMHEHGKRLTISTLPASKAGEFPHVRPCRPSSRA